MLETMNGTSLMAQIKEGSASDFSQGEMSVQSSERLTSTTGGGEECGSREFEKYAKKESKTVEVWREFAIGCIVIVGAFVACVIYWYSNSQDLDNFRTALQIVTRTIQDSVELYDQSIQEALTAFSVSITLYAKLSNSRWPTVTVPYFEVLGAHARSQTDSPWIALCPIVPEQLEIVWEMHAMKNADVWYAESLSISYRNNGGGEGGVGNNETTTSLTQQQVLVARSQTTTTTATTAAAATARQQQKQKLSSSSSSGSAIMTSRHMYRFDGDTITPDLGPGPYAPIWQITPPPPPSQLSHRNNLVNFDSLSNPLVNQLYHAMMECRCTVISRAISLSSLPFLPQQETIMIQSSQNQQGQQHDERRIRRVLVEEEESTANRMVNEPTRTNVTTGYPYSIILQPVYQVPEDAAVAATTNTDSSSSSTTPAKVVGFLLVTLSWEEYLSHFVTEENDGMYAVITNDCGQNFTFQLDGESTSVDFLGWEDYHEIYYDQGLELNILSWTQTNNNNDNTTTTTTTTTTNAAACTSHRLTVYPSRETRENYTKKNNSFVITIVILISFCVILMVFCIYEDRVQQRNDKMVQAAARTNAIVSSLFPSNVRDRLFDSNENERQSIKKRKEAKAKRNKNNKYNNKKNSSNNKINTDRRSVMKSRHSIRRSSLGQGAPRNLLQSYLQDESSIRNMDATNSLYEDDDPDIAATLSSKPIADLFPNTTVLFADIVGFTAWSSVREPSQVFMLLETLYRAFDGIAKRRRVFKVETIGDCYVAVAGLPEPRKDHAIVMARFARDCLHRMYYLSKRLEVTLGPDTGDLSMRFGLHSGPTTAGVLRGERSRFQLFGDTVNTAARIESTGRRGRIHLSQETADLINAAGKSNWITLRDDKVSAKGKGELTTYWLTVAESGTGETDSHSNQSGTSVSSSRELLRNSGNQAPNKQDLGYEDPEDFRDSQIGSMNNYSSDDNSQDNIESIGSGSRHGQETAPSRGQELLHQEHPRIHHKHKRSSSMGSGHFGENGHFQQKATRKNSYGLIAEVNHLSQKKQRLIDWNVQILQRLLKQVVARRQAVGQNNNLSLFSATTPADSSKEKFTLPTGITVLEEVKEIIPFPKFDARVAKNTEDSEFIELDQCVMDQLEHFIRTIASLYRENPFHNFEHASHVTMSVVKLLSRIVAPSIDFDYDVEEENERKLKKKLASKMHDHTYGITSDPLTQFAVVLSALIHDVDHTGVPNSQLVKENVNIAVQYKNQSVAEQNSVDLSWRLLMNPRYADLCNVICATESEWERFRQLVVNSVMATDIIDKDLKALRNARWDKAFSEDGAGGISNASDDGSISVSQDGGKNLDDSNHQNNNLGHNLNPLNLVTAVLPGRNNRHNNDANISSYQDDAINRKATIVIEHLLQASDVSHTMQHWHIFRKWNERLFHEMYRAYKSGRAEKDPGEFWYKGEIGFFDYYIIPLAKKLKECGVFGVSHDEYLNYAIHNRDEWALRGETIVKEMIASVRDTEERPVPEPPNRGFGRRLSLTG